MTQSVMNEQNFTDLKAALDDSSDKNRNLLIAFLVLQVYVFSATFSVTDLQLLLLNSDQSFSLFNFAIHMEGFFYVAPPVIFAFHFNLLLNLRQHAIKLECWLHHPGFLRHQHINLLRPFIFNLRAKIQFEQTTPYSAPHIVSFLLFSLFPLALLTFVMWRLADLQDGVLTAFHCLWVLADIAALGHFWPKITQPAQSQPTLHHDKFLLPLINTVTLLIIIKANYFVAVINTPHTIAQRLELENSRFLNLAVPRLVVTNIALDKQDKDRVSGKQTAQSNEKENDQCHRHGQYQPIDLSNRNFNLIDLSGSVICNVNFTRAKLKAANLKDATFSGNFNLASLNYAKLYYTKLQRGSSFIDADLSDTQIHQTIANEVNFTFATINNSKVSGSQFIQSQFLQANIESTTIFDSQLDHVELVGASLEGSSFEQSKLTNIDLRLVTGLNNLYFEDGIIQNCTIDYQSIPNSYKTIGARLSEKHWPTEHAAAIWITSNCCVLYAPNKELELHCINSNTNNQDNGQNDRQKLAKRLITANKLTNNDSLDLSNMGLTDISSEVFALSHLKQLNLSRNQLSNIPGAIAQLKQLQRLDFSRNQIRTIPGAIAQLNQLQLLDLSDNQITIILGAIAQLKQLQRLDLSVNKITTIPGAITQLKQLQRLDLSANKITTIPGAIAQLNQLQHLDLSFNQITTIPSAIDQLNQLQQLNLSANQITTIPSAIAQLNQLLLLDLSGNQITTIPSTIAQLNQLLLLGLSDNKITTIPGATAQLKQLQQLDLSGNQISTITGAIAQLNQLQQLDLSYNQITTIPGAIAGLKQLKHLDLSHNQITTIPGGIAQLNQLQQLDVRYNEQLTQLPKSLLQSQNLGRLCLYGTDIKALSTELEALKKIANFNEYCL